jgi:hypothetical protein
MIILQESNSAQAFSFVPRSTTYNTLTLTDEQTGVTSTVTITATATASYHQRIQATFNIKQNHFYTLEVKNNSDVVFKDKVFCTNQSIDTFSVNTSQYTSNSSNNDFIIYE